MDDLDFGATIKGFSPGQKVFNRYTLERILGRGGMGVVWLAKDGELDRAVALKFLPEVVALDKDSLDELRRETRRNLDLTHPNIVRIHDFVHDGRAAAISMEFVDGASLSALKTEQPDKIFPVAKLEPWLKQLCAALSYAHEDAQVVHRDLKPANLMIDTRGKLKVTDFGIARSISDSVSRVSVQAGSSGTPVYMSPEQMMGEKPAVTDDIYALGATLYELLTGKPPFHSGNILLQVQSKVPPSIAERRKEFGVTGDPVPEHWEKLIAACLAKEAKDRPQSIGEVAERLGLASSPNAQSPTSNAEHSSQKSDQTGRANPPDEPQPSNGSAETTRPTSKTPLFAAAVATAVLVGGLGWYFGVMLPEQKLVEAELIRQTEVARVEEQRRIDEANRIRLEQERLAAEAKVRADEQQKALAGILARIDAFTDGAAPDLRQQTDQAVTSFLAKAPANHRAEVQNRWKTRQAAWEAARKNDFLSRQLKVAVGAGSPMVLAPIAAGEMPRTGGKLRLTRPFWIGTKPVSQAQWTALMPAKSPNDLKELNGSDQPVRSTYWKEASEYCRRLTQAEQNAGRLPPGYRYDLPSEAEMAIALQQVRQLGLHGLIEIGGQVGPDWARQYFEWMSDWHGESPSGDLVDPIGPPYGSIGAFGHSQKLMLSMGGLRYPYGAGSMGSLVFRVVLTYRPEPPRLRTAAIRDGTTHVMVHFPGGSASLGDALQWGDKPAQKTISQVTRSFWLGQHAVNQAEWKAIMNTNPTPEARRRDDWPVESVSWPDVQEFCRRLTEKERKARRIAESQRFTVPTEAQWAWAKFADFHWRHDLLLKNAVLGEGQYWQYGIEWCGDWHSPDYPEGTVRDYTGPANGSSKVGRDAAGRYALPITGNPEKAVLRLVLVDG